MAERSSSAQHLLGDDLYTRIGNCKVSLVLIPKVNIYIYMLKKCAYSSQLTLLAFIPDFLLFYTLGFILPYLPCVNIFFLYALFTTM